MASCAMRLAVTVLLASGILTEAMRKRQAAYQQSEDEEQAGEADYEPCAEGGSAMCQEIGGRHAMCCIGGGFAIPTCNPFSCGLLGAREHGGGPATSSSGPEQNTGDQGPAGPGQGCESDEALFNHICGDPAVDRMDEDMMHGMALGFDDMARWQLHGALRSFLARRPQITEQMVQSLGTMPGAVNFREVLDRLNIRGKVAEVSYTSSDEVAFDASLAYMEQQGYTAFTNFILGHELSHALDFVRPGTWEGIEVDQNVGQKGPHLEVMQASVFRDTRAAIIEHNPHLGWYGAEVWADYMAAHLTLGPATLDDVLQVMRGFCRDHHPDPVLYPDARTRVMQIAKHPHVYPKLCPEASLDLYGATCDGDGPVVFGGDGCNEKVCSYALAVEEAQQCTKPGAMRI